MWNRPRVCDIHGKKMTQTKASKWNQNEPGTKARMRMRESACMCHVRMRAHAKPQATDTHSLRDRVFVCRERDDGRRRCGRDTTTRIMWNGPVCVTYMART